MPMPSIEEVTRHFWNCLKPQYKAVVKRRVDRDDLLLKPHALYRLYAGGARCLIGLAMDEVLDRAANNAMYDAFTTTNQVWDAMRCCPDVPAEAIYKPFDRAAARARRRTQTTIVDTLRQCIQEEDAHEQPA